MNYEIFFNKQIEKIKESMDIWNSNLEEKKDFFFQLILILSLKQKTI